MPPGFICTTTGVAPEGTGRLTPGSLLDHLPPVQEQEGHRSRLSTPEWQLQPCFLFPGNSWSCITLWLASKTTNKVDHGHCKGKASLQKMVAVLADSSSLFKKFTKEPSPRKRKKRSDHMQCIKIVSVTQGRVPGQSKKRRKDEQRRFPFLSHDGAAPGGGPGIPLEIEKEGGASGSSPGGPGRTLSPALAKDQRGNLDRAQPSCPLSSFYHLGTGHPRERQGVCATASWVQEGKKSSSWAPPTAEMSSWESLPPRIYPHKSSPLTQECSLCHPREEETPDLANFFTFPS